MSYPLDGHGGYFFRVMIAWNARIARLLIPVGFGLLWLSSCAPQVQPFRERPTVRTFITMLTNETSPEKRTALARSWMAEREGIPWPPYENGQVHVFLWDEERGNRPLPGIALSAHAWLPRAVPFVRLAGTPLLHAGFEAGPLDDIVYWIADGREWYRDPYNPMTAPDPLLHQASRVDLAGRGRPFWASRLPHMLRGRLEKTALGGNWFVRRSAWLYHSPATATNGRGWQDFSGRPSPVDGLLVLEMPSSSDDSVLLANCLDRAFHGSGARVVILCMESTGSDAPVGGWGFAEIVAKEAPALVFSSGGTPSGLRIGVAATQWNAAHLLHAILRNGPLVQRLWLVAPRLERHSPQLEYARSQNLPGMNGLSVKIGGGEPDGALLERVGESLRGKGARVERQVKQEDWIGLASENPDTRRSALYAIVQDWLRE